MKEFIVFIGCFAIGAIIGIFITYSIDNIEINAVRNFVNGNSVYVLDTLYNKDLTIDTIIVYKK